MTKWDYFIACLLGAVVFGCAGAFAGSLAYQVISSDFAKPHAYHTTGYSATICGFLLGPGMLRRVRERGIVSGFAVTFFAGTIHPLVVQFTNPQLRLRFPDISQFGLHDIERLASLPMFGVFVLLFTFPFSLAGGICFSRVVRVWDRGRKERLSLRSAQ